MVAFQLCPADDAFCLRLDVMTSMLHLPGTRSSLPCLRAMSSNALASGHQSPVECRHPDLWAFCNILASRHKGEPPDISSGASGGASLLPHFSAAEMLWTPILARGAGLQLKRVSTASQLQDSTQTVYASISEYCPSNLPLVNSLEHTFQS